MKILKEPEYFPIEAFHWAGINDENVSILKEILTKYPDYTHSRNADNNTLLAIATKEGNFKVVQYLIEETDININEIIPSGNALFTAIANNKIDIAEYLIDKNIDIHLVNQNKENCLFTAVKIGNDNIINKLIEKKINLNQINNKGNNILFDFFDNYLSHKNYVSFELIIQLINDETVLTKNNEGHNIFEHIKNIIYQYKYFNKYSYEEVKNLYKPLISILQNDFL